MPESPSGYQWFREEYMDRLDELATYTECGELAGRDSGRTVAAWHAKYEDFPRTVCAAGTKVSARRYLVKAEFAEWFLAHEEGIFEKEQGLYRRLQADLARSRQRLTTKRENLQRARQIHESWAKPQ